jgi:hypothetical protein
MHPLKVDLDIVVLLLVDFLILKELIFQVIDLFSKIMTFKVVGVLLLLVLLEECLDLFIFDVQKMFQLFNLRDKHVSLVVVGMLDVSYLGVLVKIKLAF